MFQSSQIDCIHPSRLLLPFRFGRNSMSSFGYWVPWIQRLVRSHCVSLNTCRYAHLCINGIREYVCLRLFQIGWRGRAEPKALWNVSTSCVRIMHERLHRDVSILYMERELLKRRKMDRAGCSCSTRLMPYYLGVNTKWSGEDVGWRFV